MTATQTYRDPSRWPEPAPPRSERPRKTARVVIGAFLGLFAVLVLWLIAIAATTTPTPEPKSDAQQYVELQKCVNSYGYAHCLNKQ